MRPWSGRIWSAARHVAPPRSSERAWPIRRRGAHDLRGARPQACCRARPTARVDRERQRDRGRLTPRGSAPPPPSPDRFNLPGPRIRCRDRFNLPRSSDPLPAAGSTCSPTPISVPTTAPTAPRGPSPERSCRRDLGALPGFAANFEMGQARPPGTAARPSVPPVRTRTDPLLPVGSTYRDHRIRSSG